MGEGRLRINEMQRWAQQCMPLMTVGRHIQSKPVSQEEKKNPQVWINSWLPYRRKPCPKKKSFLIFGRQAHRSLRLAWSTEWIPEQPGLHIHKYILTFTLSQRVFSNPIIRLSDQLNFSSDGDGSRGEGTSCTSLVGRVWSPEPIR